MKPNENKVEMRSYGDNFVHIPHDDCYELGYSETLSTESSDPLQEPEELGNITTGPKYYKIDTIVFAEPLKNISNEGNSLEDQLEEQAKEEIIFIDNVMVQNKTGRKYKKYHINIEDLSNLKCPQPNCITHVFSSTKLLKAHIRKVHCAEKSKYICEVCGRGFSARYLLMRHTAVHSGKKMECPVCKNMLSERTSLSMHLRTHTNQRPHQCKMCSKTFKRTSALAAHTKFVHREGQLKCDQCTASFSSRKKWSQHATSHRQKKPIGADTS